MLSDVPAPYSFQIALGVQLLAGFALSRLKGSRSVPAFVIFCAVVWVLCLGLASAHVTLAFDGLWFLPIIWLVIAAIIPGRRP
jgi:hypothetical protein